MTNSTYTFPVLDESRTLRIGTWTGDRAEAIERGLSHIGGSIIGGDVHYTDDTDGQTYRVSVDDVAILGAALIAGPGRDAYSLWAADVVAELVDDSDDVDADELAEAVQYLEAISDFDWETVIGTQPREEFARYALQDGQSIETAWSEALAWSETL